MIEETIQLDLGDGNLELKSEFIYVNHLDQTFLPDWIAQTDLLLNWCKED